MQMAMDAPTIIGVLTLAASAFGAYMSARSRGEIAELKLWVKDELSKYKLKEDCRDEMKAHREDIDDARGYFTRWQPGSIHPPTDKR